jgi:hypothetical protein
LTAELVLRDCTLRVVWPAGWGTAFFVAPGWAMTCGHVAKAAVDDDGLVFVEWAGRREVRARVEALEPPHATVPAGDPYPYPDLALLNVPIEGHPCVLLDHDEPEGNDDFYVWGYPDNAVAGDSCRFAYEGPSGAAERLLKLRYGEVRPGLSGAPVLNLRTGCVCGVVKLTRGVATDLGGRAIPVTTVRDRFPRIVLAHDEFHASRSTWHAALTTRQRTDLGYDAPLTGTELKIKTQLRRIDRDVLHEVAVALGISPHQPTDDLALAIARLALRCSADRLFHVASLLLADDAGIARRVYDACFPHTWIDERALDQFHALLARSAGRRAVGINSEVVETARMYVRGAGRQYPLPLGWRLDVVPAPAGEVTDRALMDAVEQALRHLLRQPPAARPDASALSTLAGRKAIVLIVPSPMPDEPLVRALLGAYPFVVFVFLAGDLGQAVFSRATDPDGEYLLPELDASLEGRLLEVYSSVMDELRDREVDEAS